MKTHLVLLQLFAITLATTACDIRDIEDPDDRPRECTLVYTPDGFFLQVEPDSPDGLPEGVYHVAIEADGISVDITGEYSSSALHCPDLGDTCSVSIDVDAQQTLIVEMYLSSGGGQNIHLKRLFDGDEDGGPAVIDVTISLDGQAIGVGHYEPEYTVREPNGVGCGTVTQASDTLLVNTLSLW